MLISLGQRGGWLINAEIDWSYRCAAPRNLAVNTVGCGDAMMAGIAEAVAEDLAPPAWLQQGIACGSSAVRYPPGILPPQRLIQQLHREIQVKTIAQS